ncbi:MAG: hypothetical protein E7351_03005 [Clostridiales bacterium]|nr:hypothetical protein [Clostridiales bacterium]
MLDKKSTSVLKVLYKLAEGTNYKVVTGDEIFASLSQKSLYDLESIRQIIDFLEKQEYINIKFSEENTYCYSLLPKARICLEQETTKSKVKRTAPQIMTYLYTMIASFIGSMLALLIFFYLTF